MFNETLGRDITPQQTDAIEEAFKEQEREQFKLLYKTLRKAKEIKGSKKTYEAEELIQIVDRAHTLHEANPERFSTAEITSGGEDIFGEGGLKGAVERILAGGKMIED